MVDFEELLDRWADEAAADEEFRLLTGDDPVDWVSLGEAEKAASVSRSTLRAWYRGGRIPSRLMPGPHGLQRLVPLQAVLEQAARSPRASGARNGEAAARDPKDAAIDAAASDAVRLAEIAIAQATERAERAEARAESAEALLHAALERAAAAEAELRLLGRQRGDESAQ